MKQTLNIAQNLSYIWKGAEIRFKPNVASVCDMFLNMHTFNKKKTSFFTVRNKKSCGNFFPGYFGLFFETFLLNIGHINDVEFNSQQRLQIGSCK